MEDYFKQQNSPPSREASEVRVISLTPDKKQIGTI